MPEATARAAAEIAKTHAVTTLIHNAGAIRPALLPEVQARGLECARQPAPRRRRSSLTQAALPAMKAAGYGRVVLVSSRAVLGAADAHLLLGDQGRHARHGAHLGARARAARHHGERGGAGADRDRRTSTASSPRAARRWSSVAQAIPVKRLGQAGRRRARGAVLRRPATPASSPARCCTSAAARASAR